MNRSGRICTYKTAFSTGWFSSSTPVDDPVPLSACQKFLDRFRRGLREHAFATDRDSRLPKQLQCELRHGGDDRDTIQHNCALEREVLFPREKQHRQTAGWNDDLCSVIDERQDLAAELLLDLHVDFLLLKSLHICCHLRVYCP